MAISELVDRDRDAKALLTKPAWIESTEEA